MITWMASPSVIVAAALLPIPKKRPAVHRIGEYDADHRFVRFDNSTTRGRRQQWNSATVVTKKDVDVTDRV